MVSVIICTYNPDERILKRVLNECLNQDFIDYELIIVDNNSSPLLSDSDWFSEFKEKVKLVTETKQGLVYARLAGFKNSVGSILAFVDDDNVIDAGYLREALKLFEKNKEVAVWGPGIIELEYPDGVPSWIDKHFSALYQKKNFETDRTGSAIEWQEYYPAGSGMLIQREIFKKYADLFSLGKISATGRKGESLASAEDSQIIWTAIKEGYQAGTSPHLKLIHIIPAKRTTLNYLRSLNYGISYSYHLAMKEMFPDYLPRYGKRTFTGKLKFIVKTLFKSGFNPLLFYRMFQINNAWPKAFEDFIEANSSGK